MPVKTRQIAGLSYWVFLYLVLLGIENVWNASWVADLFLAVLFALFFIERFNRFWTEFWDRTLSALLAPIWDAALLDPILGKAAVPDEAFWAVTARKYWQAHYMVREEHRKKLWVAWLCTLAIGPLLIFSILAGDAPLTQTAILPFVLSVFAGWFLTHTKNRPNRIQALSNASGDSSAAFRAILTSANLPDVPIPDFVHPKRRGKFFLEFGYFIGASVPVIFLFFGVVEGVSVSWNIGYIALLVLQFIGCLLLIFSWLVVIIRMGLPLARYQRGIDSPEHPCVLVWLADMQDALTEDEKKTVIVSG